MVKVQTIYVTTGVWALKAISSSISGKEVDFPPLLDSDDIAYFSSTYDIDGLHWALSNVFRRSQRNVNSRQHEIAFEELPQTLISRGGGSTYTSAYKLEQDIEQARYLLEHGKLYSLEEEEYYASVVIPTMVKVLENIPPLEDLTSTEGLYPFSKADYDLGIQEVYNKALHVPDFDVMKDVDGNMLPLLNQKFDAQKIEKQWYADEAQPGIVVIDEILSPAALERVREVLLSSTVFYQTKMPLKFGGYVGAYIDDGLYDKILIQLAFELNQALPTIMKDSPLKYLWAYKYDSRYTGINTHADQAAVNVNIWITPEDANLDKDSGGLVIYTAKPPSDWDFQKYNTDTEFVKREILEPTNYANVTVAHRENRAVIFDSALFHHTDNFHFREGYENRRINLTILYGDMNPGGTETGGSEL